MKIFVALAASLLVLSTARAETFTWLLATANYHGGPPWCGIAGEQSELRDPGGRHIGVFVNCIEWNEEAEDGSWVFHISPRIYVRGGVALELEGTATIDASWSTIAFDLDVTGGVGRTAGASGTVTGAGSLTGLWAGTEPVVLTAELD
jgi:hypothetical protein